MPTITLTGNANVSALTLANGDTIDLAGFTLTMNAQPTATGVQVTSPGTAGKVIFSVAISVPTWSFTAGTARLIETLPANCSVGTVTGGTNTNAQGVAINNGTIASAVGGTGQNANGINTSNGTITGNVIGGPSGNARGAFTNYGTITGNVIGGTGESCPAIDDNRGTIAGSVIGGSTSGAHGMLHNYGTIIGNVSGGSNASAHGVQNNSGTIRGNVIGGSAATAVLNNNGLIEGRVEGGAVSTARGVGTNRGPLLGAVANSVSANAVATWQGSSFVINGPQFQVALPDTVTRVYSLFGSPGALATIPVGASVVVLNEVNGTGLSPVFNVKHLGDFAAGATIRGSFSTRAANGDAITLAGSPAIAVYRDADVSESVAGVAIAVDFDGRTGYHVFTVTATDAFYTAGSDYRIVLTAGTVSGRSVAGIEVGSFSIDNRAASPARTATAVVEKVVDGTEGEGAVGTILHAISTMIENVSGLWRWKGSAMSETPKDPMVEEIRDIVENLGYTEGSKVIRAVDDFTPIHFVFPVENATLTGTKSVNGGSSTPIEGTITAVDIGLAGYWYLLDYDAQDRTVMPDDFIVYNITDGSTDMTILLVMAEGSVVTEIERESGPLYKTFRKFDGIDKLIKWIRQ